MKCLIYSFAFLFSFTAVLSWSQEPPSPANNNNHSANLPALQPAPAGRPETIDELTRAAEGGDVLAQNNLGFAFAFGKGVGRNYAEAARWFSAAASREFAPAQFNLGALYENGLGVPQDYATAFALIQASALKGYALAQTRVGYFY